jgi:hypothetical protein
MQMLSPVLALIAQRSRTFYFRRARARHAVGRLADAIADCEKAAKFSSDYLNEGSRIQVFQEFLMRNNGNYKAAIALLEGMAQRLNLSNTNKSRAFDVNFRILASSFLAKCSALSFAI